MQINHMLTTSPKSIGDNILSIVQYGPKPAEEIIGTESLSLKEREKGLTK